MPSRPAIGEGHRRLQHGSCTLGRPVPNSTHGLFVVADVVVGDLFQVSKRLRIGVVLLVRCLGFEPGRRFVVLMAGP